MSQSNTKCKDCNQEINLGLILSAKLWEALGLKEEDTLCASCLMKRLEKIKHGYIYELLQMERPNLRWVSEEEDDTNLKKCSYNHATIYYRGIGCPMCKFKSVYNELRAMYFEEYNRNPEGING